MAEDLIEMGRKRCGRGEIRRRGYTIKKGDAKGTRVAPTCVPDKGAPGKAPPSKRYIKDLKEGALDGWHHNESAKKRRAAIRKDVRQVGCRKTILRLNAMRVLNKRQAPAAARTAVTDMNWLRKQDFCKLKTKNEK